MAEVAWEELPLRCILTHQRLVEPARGRRCTHLPRVNASVLRPGTCPVCNKRIGRRSTDIEVDNSLVAYIATLGPSTERIWVSGDKMRIDAPGQSEARSLDVIDLDDEGEQPLAKRPRKSKRKWSVGQPVEAQWGSDGDELWFDAIVAAVHGDGRIDVRYDDGDEEQGKDPARVRQRTRQVEEDIEVEVLVVEEGEDEEAAEEAPRQQTGLPPGWLAISDYGKRRGYRGPAGERVPTRKKAWEMHVAQAAADSEEDEDVEPAEKDVHGQAEAWCEAHGGRGKGAGTELGRRIDESGFNISAWRHRNTAKIGKTAMARVEQKLNAFFAVARAAPVSLVPERFQSPDDLIDQWIGVPAAWWGDGDGYYVGKVFKRKGTTDHAWYYLTSAPGQHMHALFTDLRELVITARQAKHAVNGMIYDGEAEEEAAAAEEMEVEEEVQEEQEDDSECELVTEAQGFELHLSDRSGTGYAGVRRVCSRFHATGPKRRHIGSFSSAVEAAVAYARAMAEPRAGADPEEEEGNEEAEEDLPSEAQAWGSASGLVHEDQWEVEQLLRRRYTRQDAWEYLVRWQGWSDAYDSWEPEEHIGSALVAEYDALHLRPALHYAPGDAVEAMFRATGRFGTSNPDRSPGWFAGHVVKVHANGTYDVDYTDGDTEKGVLSQFVRHAA